MINMGQILGRVGRIETKTVTTGNKITTISMVTAKKYLKEGVKQEKTTWHNVTLFNKLADIAEKYVNVGDLLFVQGEMDSKKYTGKDGQEKNSFFLIGYELKLMPKTKELSSTPKEKTYDPEAFNDDEIPF